MSNSVRFAKACPTCGRTLQIPVELLGRDVCCHGCGAGLRATVSDEGSKSGTTEDIDARVDRLIQAADKQLQHFTPATFS
jgi:hypothetical protein